MRLRDLKRIIDTNSPSLTYEIVPAPGQASLRRVSKYLEVIEASENYRRFGLFTSLTSELAGISEIYTSKLPIITVDASIADRFAISVEKLKAASTSLLEVLDSAIPKQEKNFLSIKLPNYSNLSEFGLFFQKLDFIINQALTNDYLKTEVRLKNFDSGTYWIEIAITSQIALSFFASLVWAAAVIRKKIVEIELLEQQVVALKIRNESLNDIKDSAKRHLDLMLESETNNLVNQLKLDKPDPEYSGRLRLAIKEMAELIAKGTEVYPALMAPEEVKNLLPDFKMLDTIQSKIKQLEQ